MIKIEFLLKINFLITNNSRKKPTKNLRKNRNMKLELSITYDDKKKQKKKSFYIFVVIKIIKIIEHGNYCCHVNVQHSDLCQVKKMKLNDIKSKKKRMMK